MDWDVKRGAADKNGKNEKRKPKEEEEEKMAEKPNRFPYDINTLNRYLLLRQACVRAYTSLLAGPRMISSSLV